ncbi:MAG: hypothetical protein K0U93_11670 [Gammaproteobacteria bacterium]|nr:hypothetical protein [Gammaproteobacteria bacterium]
MVAVASVHAQVSTRGDEASRLLNEWYAAGHGAGNHGDYYDNRDRGHSSLPGAAYPQLRRFVYNANEMQRNLDWRAPSRLIFAPVIGNASMSSPPRQGGSLVRHYYSTAQGIRFLHSQYRVNNLYVYPEHKDHDPLPAGLGDLFPTNTPYVVMSQGSSGSDQPFVHALVQTMAAFRPEVKAALIRFGVLAPTLQFIMRRHSRRVATPDQYYEGHAHPSVFAARDLDPLAMVRAAQELTVATIPPVAQLKLIQAPQSRLGVDYFEPTGSVVTESLATTPGAIARVVRAGRFETTLTVGAGALDINGFALEKVDWVVLRGDRTRIRIKPFGPNGQSARLAVDYHGTYASKGDITSSRVDIGVFVRTKAGVSVPGFVTFFYLANEHRRYDNGRLAVRRFGPAHGAAARYVDTRLTAPKRWRDEYRYEVNGALAGWTRYLPDGERYQFKADGTLLDAAGQSVPVNYQLGPDGVLRMRAKP